MANDAYFFAWEEGRRHSFYFSRARFPLFVSAGEDYLVEPDGPDHCRFTWRVGITPTVMGRAGAPLSKRLFRSYFRDTGRYFDAAQSLHTR
ncbi:hypothetical protein RM704_35870 [Streptomyces sp. DSM 3412]|uniref:Uncharacterized protein n=1 Tax=Streptomyces gottesmaniae TaxID=3075518 RepID=A0ABU2Z9A3_9ACTN|nr:hypothetical protein [Streptomyces sp. DSM 3412]MDT0572781.1 hypothetical protein [Streptomyces sp. DSM 3412]